jgi:hypothetical protein
MDSEQTIYYNNKEEQLIKYNCESLQRFNKRLEFIKILEDNNVSWKNANKLSKCWFNITYNNCKYPKDIYENVKKYNKLLEGSKIS